MAGDPDPIRERQRRLAQVRVEIDRELAEGSTLSAADWIRRYPDLEPELGEMLRGLLESGPTQFDRAAGGGETGVEATIDVGSMAPPESPQTEIIESLTRPERADLDETHAATQAGEADQTVADPNAGIEPTAFIDPLAETAPAPPTQPTTGQKVRYIGDYETTAILGQGGMGVVYKARQLSLNRFVALKMIRNAEFAGEEQVRRFQNEAEAVATLDHEGIVPIYEVGTFEDQRYFSMKLVDGGGMDKKLKDLAKDPKRAARVVAEVADAVHHAHQRGILHRDLKPANILLDHSDHAHVTDFGLAKRIEEDAGLTVTGAIMGTPSYMSPEQAAGRTSAVTTASDVYGLGAILYAALTGRAPFASDSVLNTLDQVRNSPPQPPTRLNAKLPRDLEVICLKCLEKEARHRYPSAQALHDDLHRWLRGEPIAARPVGPVVRLGMWAKRKPALAGLSLALILGTILGTVGIVIQWREAVAQRDKAEIARNDAIREEKAARKAEGEAKASRDAAVASEKQAVEARALAEKNFQTASEQATTAVDTIQLLVDQVLKDLDAPGLYEIKKKILKAAIEKVDRVANIYAKTSTDKGALKAGALLQLGRIYKDLGESEKALPMFQKSLELFKERVEVKKGNDTSRFNLAVPILNLSMLSRELRRDTKLALNYNQDLVRLCEDIYDHPKPDGYPLQPTVFGKFFVDAYIRLGAAHQDMGELNLALEYYRRANNLARKLLVEFKGDLKLKQQLSYTNIALAEASYRLGDRAGAETSFQEAVDQREFATKLDPADQETRAELGGVYYEFGEYKLRFGILPAARRDLERSRDERKTVLDREPETVKYQRNLGLSYYRLGNLADQEGNPEASSRDFQASLALFDKMAKTDPNNDRRQAELMLVLPHVGEIARAQKIADRLSVGPKVDRQERIELARCYAQIARATPPGNVEAVQTALVNSVSQIELAVREGYRDRVEIETEPDLEPIRNRDRFKQILDEIKPK